jgi:GAF domain-containing protein
MSEILQPAQLMQRVADQTLQLISGADGVMLGLADHQGVSYHWGAGRDAANIGTRVDLNASLSGLAIRTRQVQWCDDTTTDPRVDAATCRRNSIGSTICVPLTRGNEILGIVAVSSTHAHAFTHQDISLLTQLADFVGVAITSARDLSRATTQLLGLSPPLEPST